MTTATHLSVLELVQQQAGVEDPESLGPAVGYSTHK